MEKIFEFRNGKIRVTYNEVQKSQNIEEKYVRASVKRKTRRCTDEYSVGVEAMAHTGGRMCYGKLSVSMRPQEEADKINIAIAVTEENTVKLSNSLLLDDSYVYCSLPEEYAEHMLDCVINAIEAAETFPQCVLVFEEAANCEAGSSSMYFGGIAELLIRMIEKDNAAEIFLMNENVFAEQFFNGEGAGRLCLAL